MAAVAKEWQDTLADPGLVRLPASQMYKGLHWQQTLACVKEAQAAHFDASLWVLSAGYGLISGEQNIAAYSATFGPGRDSIHNLPWPAHSRPSERCRVWWQMINHGRRGQRSLRDLVNTEAAGQRFFLCILSKEYYPALEPDLLHLASAGENVLIVSAGAYKDLRSASPLLRDHIVPLSEKVRFSHDGLNKPNVAINASVALWLLTYHSNSFRLGWESVRDVFAQFHGSLPAYERPAPKKMTDEEILAFIRSCCQKGSTSATQLLRKLRHDVGKSCEQKRFGALYGDFVRTCGPAFRRLMDD